MARLLLSKANHPVATLVGSDARVRRHLQNLTARVDLAKCVARCTTLQRERALSGSAQQQSPLLGIAFRLVWHAPAMRQKSSAICPDR